MQVLQDPDGFPISRNPLKVYFAVLDLIYWRDPKKSGIALGALLAALFVLTRFVQIFD